MITFPDTDFFDDVRALKPAAEALSDRYRNRTGGRFVSTQTDALAYAAARMPATFAAVADAGERLLNRLPEAPQTILDVGAGTGAATLALSALTEFSRAVCLEREDVMREVGKKIVPFADWRAFDAVADAFPEKAGLVVSSYMLNELPADKRLDVVQKMWDAAEQALLIVETGTPEACAMMKDIRAFLTEKGAFLAAPCARAGACPVDWCHFSVRVARTKLHRFLKGGQAAYEDEKFSYLAFSRVPVERAAARVLRHPQTETGRVTLTLCTADGVLEKTFSKRDKGGFKAARKARWGDCL